TVTGDFYAIAIGIAPVAQTRWEAIQRVIQRATTSSLTGAATLPVPVTSGNFVVGALAGGDGSKLTGITDDKSNTSYTVIAGTLGNNSETGAGNGFDYRQTFWSGKLLTNGPQTFTATYSESQEVNFIMVTEFAPPPNI